MCSRMCSKSEVPIYNPCPKPRTVLSIVRKSSKLSLCATLHDEWLIPQIWEVVRGLQGKVEVLKEEVRRQGEEIRRLRRGR